MKINNYRIALFEPRIPQNTGNIARTCAAYNFSLELIKPLGFSLDDKYLKRAGLDYWQYVDVNVHEDYSKFLLSIGTSRIIGFSRFSHTPLPEVKFIEGDVLLFGREDTGLPKVVKDSCYAMSRIPMPCSADKDNKNGVRSLNLSVACGVVAYEANNQLIRTNE